jgi:threonine/homoserine/homoserine lactone efflux protein
MIDATTLLAIGLAFFVVAVSPGPANISNAAIAMSHGRRKSLTYATGLSCGLGVWGVVAATGMGAVLQGSVHVLIGMKLFGGAYLLWLAYQSGRSAMRTQSSDVAAVSQGRWFLRGLALNLSNPKSVIAWMAALAVGLDPGDGVGALIVATALCIGLGFVNNWLYSIVFSMTGMMAVYRRTRRSVDGVVAGLFAIAGLGLIRSAVAR